MAGLVLLLVYSILPVEISLYSFLMEPTSTTAITIIAVFVGIVLLVRAESIYVRLFKTPFFVHIPFGKSPLSKQWKQFMAKHNRFYSKLNEKERRAFDKRIVSFIKNHEFIGNQVDLTMEKKILISTIPVMLTFGMRDFLFNSIDKIIVYPREYYSTITKKYHKGELNPMAKAVVLSWEDFEKGIEIVDDNLNLGVHEFAHALFFSCKRNGSVSCRLFASQFAGLLATLALPEMRKRVVRLQYFREYGFQNQYEFIAVVFECFFETPSDFKKKLPELYAHVKGMLNIDTEKVYLRNTTKTG